jgi:G:T-mismatch repair DNA endonuclease (very short patch repair protein)
MHQKWVNGKWKSPMKDPIIAKGVGKKLKEGEYMKKRWDDPEYAKNHSDRMTKQWKDPEYRERTLRNQRKGNNTKPNKKESFLDNFIQSKAPNQYLLNVNGKTIINGRVPDWININGEKKVILHQGIYWHLGKLLKKFPNLTKRKVESIEKKPYNDMGFEVLFIWEDELKNEEKLLAKIQKFIGHK